MKPNQTTLTNEEFIDRSKSGERFEYDGDEFYYDASKENPFQISGSGIDYTWRYFDGKTIFTIVTPKKTIVIEEWLCIDASKRYFIYIGEHKYFTENCVNRVQKLSERTVEVEVEKAQS